MAKTQYPKKHTYPDPGTYKPALFYRCCCIMSSNDIHSFAVKPFLFPRMPLVLSIAVVFLADYQHSCDDLLSTRGMIMQRGFSTFICIIISCHQVWVMNFFHCSNFLTQFCPSHHVFLFQQNRNSGCLMFSLL